MANFKLKFAAFQKTFVGKIVLSAARAFIGVFIAAEAQLFNLFVQLVNSHTQVDFGVLKNLVFALTAAGAVAAVRAVQHFFFDTPAT